MNYIQKLSVLAFAFICFVASSATAQVGHINSQVVFADMATTKSAQSQLESESKRLSEELGNREKALQQKIEGAKQRAVNMTANEIKALEAEVQKEAVSIDNDSKKYQMDLINKEQELLKPAVDKFQGAIEAVAKENGYKFILDSSVLLYSEPSSDVTSKVKAKLN